MINKRHPRQIKAKDGLALNSAGDYASNSPNLHPGPDQNSFEPERLGALSYEGR